MERSEYESIRLRYQIRKMKTNDVVSAFDCGDDDLNDYI